VNGSLAPKASAAIAGIALLLVVVSWWRQEVGFDEGHATGWDAGTRAGYQYAAEWLRAREACLSAEVIAWGENKGYRPEVAVALIAGDDRLPMEAACDAQVTKQVGPAPWEHVEPRQAR
jgi:hypothetical protein